jgi:anti-sigma B factor antagonist
MTDAEPLTPAHRQAIMVTLPAEIDMVNADSICAQIAAESDRGNQVVIADISATTFCDTLGTRALLLAHRRAVEAGSELRLLRPGPRIMRVWGVLGVDVVLPIYHSLEEAMAGVG